MSTSNIITTYFVVRYYDFVPDEVVCSIFHDYNKAVEYCHAKYAARTDKNVHYKIEEY